MKTLMEVDKRVKQGQDRQTKALDHIDRRLAEQAMEVRRDVDGLRAIVERHQDEMGHLRVGFEAIRKPFSTEMNNIRRENEGINREMNRMMGQIRELTAHQTFYPKGNLSSQTTRHTTQSDIGGPSPLIAKKPF